jgi:hypothetical protein
MGLAMNVLASSVDAYCAIPTLYTWESTILTEGVEADNQ